MTPFGPRRVRGLRREELAELAGVSADYYARLEQGRAQPSSEVLDAVASALELTPDERQHLRAPSRTAARPRRSPPLVVRPGVRQLLHVLGDLVPAYVLGPYTEVLAFNRLAEEVIFPFASVPPAERYMVRIVLMEPFVRERHQDWERTAKQVVGLLRSNTAGRAEDPRLSALVGELTLRSEVFATLWAAHHVQDKRSGRKLLTHPAVGAFGLDFDTFRPVEDPELSVVMLSARPGTEDETALRLVSSVTGAPA